jgi:hypothetical protein
MKNFLITLAVAVAASLGAFGVAYLTSDAPALSAAAREGDAMTWLRVEFRLSETQFAAIKGLHEDYSIACGKHCADIIDARERKAPAAEVAALEKICVDSMTGHFRRVAALMPAGQGDRYLAMVLPRIAGYSHQGAPNVRVKP